MVSFAYSAMKHIALFPAQSRFAEKFSIIFYQLIKKKIHQSQYCNHLLLQLQQNIVCNLDQLEAWILGNLDQLNNLSIGFVTVFILLIDTYSS